MFEIKFIYNKIEINVKYSENDSINSIINQFCEKTNLDKNNLSFLFEGKLLETQNLNNEKIIGQKNNKRIIFVFNNDDYFLTSFKQDNNSLKNNDISEQKGINEITLIYKIKDNNSGYIQILGETFVKNNKNICTYIFEGKEYELKSTFDFKSSKESKEYLEIKLKGIKNIKDFSYMFDGCYSLYSLPDISEINIEKANCIKCMFFSCSSLTSISDISKWDTKNINNMLGLFYGCSSLKSLPDISQWNTENVKYFQYMFSRCKSLLSLPDISKWNTSKAEQMQFMFSECSSLLSLPDISKWNMSKMINIEYMFNECFNLTSIPDISKWDTSNVQSISKMFFMCSSLSSLPDISKWNLNNLNCIYFTFTKCISLSSFPDIDKYDKYLKNFNVKNLMYDCINSIKQFD